MAKSKDKDIQRIMNEPNYDARLELAALHLGENALELIKHILMKHDSAVIEAGHEAVQAAVLEERQACMKICKAESDRAMHQWKKDLAENKPFWNGFQQGSIGCFELIEARGKK